MAYRPFGAASWVVSSPRLLFFFFLSETRYCSPVGFSVLRGDPETREICGVPHTWPQYGRRPVGNDGLHSRHTYSRKEGKRDGRADDDIHQQEIASIFRMVR